MKKFIFGCLFLVGALSLTAFTAQDGEKKEDGKAKVECCCEECDCEKCTCNTDCSDCRGCKGNEACRECRDCDHDGHCCDYGHHGRKRHRRGGCCGPRGC